MACSMSGRGEFARALSGEMEMLEREAGGQTAVAYRKSKSRLGERMELVRAV